MINIDIKFQVFILIDFKDKMFLNVVPIVFTNYTYLIILLQKGLKT